MRTSIKTFATNLHADIDEIYCQICLRTTPESSMLLCDHCNNGYHLECLHIPRIPIGNWFCPECINDINYKAGNAYIDPVEDVDLLNYLKG